MIDGFMILNGIKPKAAPSLKITARGLFINREARRQMGDPTRIQIGIDEPGFRLAVCPVAEGGIALSCGQTVNRGVLAQVLAVFGADRVLVGRKVDGGMLFGHWEDD